MTRRRSVYTSISRSNINFFSFQVQEILFALFEKHQFYNIKDLAQETRQPMAYLKQILKEVCNYSVKPPNRNMWELKPEYRHYKPEDEDDKKKARNDSSSDSD